MTVRLKNPLLWLHSAVSAFISGAAGATAVMAIDPVDFNPTTGWRKLLAVALVMGVIGLTNYLKEHPVPPLEEEK